MTPHKDIVARRQPESVDDPLTEVARDGCWRPRLGQRLTSSSRAMLPVLDLSGISKQEHTDAGLVFSGGSGRLRDTVVGCPTIPSVAADVLVSLGISPDRITWQDQSRNRAEYARFSHEITAPAPGQTWVLVTSAFHIGRALANFKAARWGAIAPYPVDYRTGRFSAGIGLGLAGNLLAISRYSISRSKNGSGDWRIG